MNILKRIFFSLLFLTVLIIVIFFFFKKLVYSSVPEYSGEIYSGQVHDNIKIYFDENKVPNIITGNDLDAAFAIGFLHARERMFQMDLYRRAAEGRLSEVFGMETVKYDKMFRTLDFVSTVPYMLEKLNDRQIKFLEAYSNGINYYLENNSSKSIEFDILGYEPEKWEVKHSLILTKLLAWELNISWWSDVAFANLSSKVSYDKLKEIVPDYPDGDKSMEIYLSSILKPLNEFYEKSVAFKKFTGFEGTNPGSNNWVVSGSKSENGKPLIANDPHLAFQAPGKWYLVNIFSDKLKAKGFTMAGLPLVIIGLNENISWVLTNVMCDDADFYIEKFDSSGTKYLYDGKWRNAIIKKDTIKVKNESDIIFTKKKTHRGPVISDSHPFYESFSSTGAVSMRWTALEFHEEFKSFYKINYSQNWNDFSEALKYYSTPGQNFVYADSSGNIGYILGAKIPKRRTVSSTFVYDGTKKSSDWKGFYSYEDNLKLYNPSKNFIGTANNKIYKNNKIYISNIWEPPARIERIYELLSAKEMFSVKDFMEIQNDLKSKYSEKIIYHLSQAFTNVKLNDKFVKTSLDLLKKWDNRFDKNTQSPLIYSYFFNNLLENIYKDEMGDVLYKQFIFMSNIPYRTTLKLLNKGVSYWFDNINTSKIENKNTIIRKSFIDAVKNLKKRFGENIALWQWGKVHKIKFKHIFSGKMSIIDEIADIGPFEIGGELTTINNGSYSLVDPYDVNIGPSMRFIYDFSTPEKYFYVLNTGQSGHMFSDYYKNQTHSFVKGNYYESNFKKENFENYDLLEIRRGEE